MAATLTQERFTGPEWIFERKLDGIRLLAFRQGGAVRLLSRNQRPQRLPSIERAIAALPLHEVILDGELTWSESATYHVFDVLWIDGQKVTGRPLEERRSLLAELPMDAPLMRVGELKDAKPWERACAEGWEGVVAKRRDSVYEHRRSPMWLKMKCELSQDFIIGGFTDPHGARVGLGALLVGYHDGGDFAFAGKVGTGLDTKMLIDLRARLDSIQTSASPFTKGKGLPRKGAHWVQPQVVVSVAFIEWTVHRKLRHPRLLRIRW
jgi:bifunctional non-homologous end joining protein LigD